MMSREIAAPWRTAVSTSTVAWVGLPSASALAGRLHRLRQDQHNPAEAIGALTPAHRHDPITGMRRFHDGVALRRYTFAVAALFLLLACGIFVSEADAQTASSPTFTYLSSPASGKAIRYWDCCKPSASWPGKASVSAPVKACAKDGKTTLDANAASSCNGGTSYACSSDQPWVVNANLSYGFTAASIVGKSESDIACACYELKFTSGPVTGKTFVAQVVNMGGASTSNLFSLMIPGGGVGVYNGCQAQWLAPSDGWGARYGGVSSKSNCATLPRDLQPGCNWRFDWFQNADNPDLTFRRITCPTEITAKTGCKRKDE
jgi:glycosyl hydrolase family 45